MEIKDREFWIFLVLGTIMGISLSIIVFSFIVYPRIIYQIRTEAVDAKVGEFYLDNNHKLKFRYLTEERE